jgi:hypothetical protein
LGSWANVHVSQADRAEEASVWPPWPSNGGPGQKIIPLAPLESQDRPKRAFLRVSHVRVSASHSSAPSSITDSGRVD